MAVLGYGRLRPLTSGGKPISRRLERALTKSPLKGVVEPWMPTRARHPALSLRPGLREAYVARFQEDVERTFHINRGLARWC